MKFGFAFLVFLWLLCGLIGAWMLDDLSVENWEVIARGPLTLFEAIRENPASLPGGI